MPQSPVDFNISEEEEGPTTSNSSDSRFVQSPAANYMLSMTGNMNSSEDEGPATSHTTETSSAQSPLAGNFIIDDPHIRPNEFNCLSPPATRHNTNRNPEVLDSSEEEDGQTTSNSSDSRFAHSASSQCMLSITANSSEEEEGPPSTIDTSTATSPPTAQCIFEDSLISLEQINHFPGHINMNDSEVEEQPPNLHSSETRSADLPALNRDNGKYILNNTH